MKFLPININKRILWRYVNIKIKRIIHHYHVFSVISILFEEMIKDLKKGLNIRIHNFGILLLKETKPRFYHDVTKKEVLKSKSHKIIQFLLNSKIRKILKTKLDLEKTFKG